jgi:alkylhydroperoxidase family enzyme
MVEYENASDEVKKLWDEHARTHAITNMKKTLLRDPESFKVLMEWYELYDRVCKVTGKFGADVFSYAISTENDCLICSTFFRKILIDAGKDPDNLDLSEREWLLVDYGRACVKQPVRVDNELFGRMKKEFSDEEIVLLTAFAGMMIATNLINHALAVDIDDRLLGYEKK